MLICFDFFIVFLYFFPIFSIFCIFYQTGVFWSFLTMREKGLTIITSNDPSKDNVHAGGYHLKRCLAWVRLVHE